MVKWINILSVLFLMIASIEAQGSGRFRRLMFLRNRQLALQRAFPFGVPLTMRGGAFPTRFSTRFPFSTTQRPFRFGPDPFSLTDFGITRFPGGPFGTSPAFPPAFFQGQRFGTPSPFGAGSFGIAGTPGGFLPGGSGFPAGSGFVDGRLPPTGSGFPTNLDGTRMPDQTGGTSVDSTGGMSRTDQGTSTGSQNDLNNAGTGQTFPETNNIFPDFNTPRPGTGSGAGQFPAGTGQFPEGTGQFPAGTGQFPEGTGQFPAGTGQFPAGAGQFPAGAGQFPAGTGQFPAGAGQFPAQFPAGTGQFPSGAGQFPTGAGQFPTATGQFPTAGGRFPTGAGRFPTGFGQFPTGLGGQFPAGRGQFLTRPGMAGSMGGLTPGFPTRPAFGPGFRQPGTAPFPMGGTGRLPIDSAGAGMFPAGRTGNLPGDRAGDRMGTTTGDMTTGFQGDRTSAFPDPRGSVSGQFPSGQAGLGQGFGQSDRSGATFPRRQGDLPRDPRDPRDPRFGLGPSPFDPTPSFQGIPPFGAQFPQDPRFAGFGQSGRFAAGPGPEFNTRGNPADPNFNLQFQSFPGANPMPGQFGGSAGPDLFPSNPDMGNRNVNNDLNNNNNNQMAPAGNQAAPIDGFGAVTSNNNLNDNIVISGSRTENPADFIRLDEGAANTGNDVIVTTANNMDSANAAAAGSNEFRVVEVGNILDAPGGAGRGTVSSSDRSVVDSMGFQPAETANIGARDTTETVVVSEGNAGNTNTGSLNLPSPLNQDFSFFVPSDNTGPASEPQGGATFTVPAPPPPPPIMVANDNNQQPEVGSLKADTKEAPTSLDLFGFVTHDPSGADSVIFPIDGTEHRRIGDPKSNTGNEVIKPEVTTTTESLPVQKGTEHPKSNTGNDVNNPEMTTSMPYSSQKVEEKPKPSTTPPFMDIANNMI